MQGKVSKAKYSALLEVSRRQFVAICEADFQRQIGQASCSANLGEINSSSAASRFELGAGVPELMQSGPRMILQSNGPPITVPTFHQKHSKMSCFWFFH